MLFRPTGYWSQDTTDTVNRRTMLRFRPTGYLGTVARKTEEAEGRQLPTPKLATDRACEGGGSVELPGN